MITDYVKAGYPALLVRTHEQERFISSMIPRLNGRTTYTWDLAHKIKELLTKDRINHYGICHMANSGQCSWYEFAAMIFELEGLNSANLRRVTSEEFRSKVLRPHYSVLGSKVLEFMGIEPLRPWQDALKDYMAQRRQRTIL